MPVIVRVPTTDTLRVEAKHRSDITGLARRERPTTCARDPSAPDSELDRAIVSG
jgi:hypothetical protein